MNEEIMDTSVSTDASGRGGTAEGSQSRPPASGGAKAGGSNKVRISRGKQQGKNCFCLRFLG